MLSKLLQVSCNDGRKVANAIGEDSMLVMATCVEGRGERQWWGVGEGNEGSKCHTRRYNGNHMESL